MGPRLIGREDEDYRRRCGRSWRRRDRGAPRCGASASHRIAKRRLSVKCTEGDPEIIGSDVLLAVGRRPNTDDLGLDQAGVAVDARGYITVDDFLAPNVAGIWALGDCNGRGAFTQTAYNDFEIVAANLLDGEHGAGQRPDARLRLISIRRWAVSVRPRPGARHRPEIARRQALDDARRPCNRKGRDVGL